MDWPHLIDQALTAHHLYKRDRNYVVDQGQVIIVDEHTGRLQYGRTWADGLHQAIEAKEHLQIREENQTLATITVQNFFRMYTKLAGMTGTAATEAEEFGKIYGLDVVVIPTNRPLIRDEKPDRIFLEEDEKFKAVVEEIVHVHETGRPILVGTVSIEKNEMLSKMLERRGVEHEMLNAKQHQREAAIVAQAGREGAVTIATNMAGRGTDIKLGEGVAENGGLHVLGTRRIDNQLRGRTGRQGDPGSSQFFISLEDDLMRIFAGEWVRNFLGKYGGMGEGQAIEMKFVSNQITKAQKRVEELNFESRKSILEYDTVMDEQRSLVYEQRQQILEGADLKEMTHKMLADVAERNVALYASSEVEREEWDLKGLALWAAQDLGLELTPAELEGRNRDALTEYVQEGVERRYSSREAEIGSENMRRLERFVLLEAIDAKWKDHLHAMDQLKHSIGLRAYGQKDPKMEYKIEGYAMFQEMIDNIKEQVSGLIFKLRIDEGLDLELASDLWKITSESGAGVIDQFQRAQEMAAADAAGASEEKPEPFVRTTAKVGRNKPCPCGSGKKYKKCCGRAGAS
jgi:preprotein translocase subunit SecA